MWALIKKGTVAEITATDPAKRFHPSLQWVVCPVEVAPGWLYDGASFAAPAVPAVNLGELLAQIDSAADAAHRAVVGDPLRALEYERVAAEAQAFADAGYPDEAVPRTVAAWAIGGRTPKAAADSILGEAAQYTDTLYQIRETRLQAKELVRQAVDTDDIERSQYIAATAIASIRGLVVGAGNVHA